MQPTVKELRDLLGEWRAEAAGHYCQTYNIGKAEGLREAARELENLLLQRRLTTASTVTSAGSCDNCADFGECTGLVDKSACGDFRPAPYLKR